MSSRDAAERSGLDREEVVRTALHLLDEVGLEGVTMRALAVRLGVKAASLYWHLRDKDELQDLMVEAINAELPDPDPTLAWRESLERQAFAWRRLLLGHRDAARMVMGRFVARPNTLRQVEHVLDVLRRAGFDDRDAANAGYLFSTFIPGFVAEETVPRSVSLPAFTRAGQRAELPSPLTGPGRPADASRAEAAMRAFEASQGGGAAEHAHLEVESASRLTITGDPSLSGLYQVEAEGREPDVEADQGVVTFRTRGRRPSSLALNALLSWTIRFRGGASRLEADLRALRVDSLRISGGASGVDLTLPAPRGTLPIEVSGGASRVSIHRSAEVPVRIEVRGGVSRLTFDHRPFPSAGELTVQSPAYDRAEDRVALTISGGANRISVDPALPPGRKTRPPATGAPGGPAFEGYPTLSSLAPLLAGTSMDERFAFSLRTLLDGLERLIG